MAIRGVAFWRRPGKVAEVGGGLCIYTARTTHDPDFGKGTHHGEGLYESGGFIVHFFSAETVECLADGYDIVEVEHFEEGTLPRRLVSVSMRKPHRPGWAGTGGGRC